MSDKSDLENRAIEAIWNYREAFAVVGRLERKQRSAHRSLTKALIKLRRATKSEDPRSLKDSIEITLAAVSRHDEARATLDEAAALMESARLTLAALERQLGYLPRVLKA
ncbi:MULTISPECIES: hypothetical protein [Bradyrhizobium]|uniref:hypothetical protein n=1 Tax=Bradyrhizobium TaxID=374 RepID=UPI000D64D00E|nr:MULTISPECIES: hypothetical protein [Bradyrhizobium]MCA1414370.1 hypothetical protein [Bradyrhizobium sp. NBAIM20]MCA1465626.1 hypothetical protein [Bradyrhizobium sp. NBAIM18]MCA1530088.1 hypothetical protein [Bradyrhizobium yuanmingense]PWE75473.1 hypothetical protein XF30_00635 [Bradyrhizobium sp. SUTN9-2]